MDRDQADHLKAYGLAYWTLERGEKAEWLLNYRAGSFLLPDLPGGEAGKRPCAASPMSAMDPSGEARMRATDRGLEHGGEFRWSVRPKVAIYTPPNSTPWDDAVTMALEYAGIPYETIWDNGRAGGRPFGL